jgi:hypothetical protein
VEKKVLSERSKISNSLGCRTYLLKAQQAGEKGEPRLALDAEAGLPLFGSAGMESAGLPFAQHGALYAWLSRRWLTRSAPLGWHRMTRSMVKQRAIAALRSRMHVAASAGKSGRRDEVSAVETPIAPNAATLFTGI